MPRITITLSENLVEELQNIAKKTNKSFSKTASEIIELGIKFYEKQEDLQTQNKLRNKQELEEKHTEYLLRILAFNTDILRCVLNEKSKYNGKKVDEIIDIISTSAKTFIDNYINKD